MNRLPQIIPKAVDYFTGKALEYDLMDESDWSESDDEDDEDDEDGSDDADDGSDDGSEDEVCQS
jgi:nucleosome assembly protein 1-like 1